METLSNFSSIYCFITFVIGAVFMLAMLSIAAINKEKEPSNRVHFYVARDKDGTLWLYMGKPVRCYDVFNTDISNGSKVLTSHSFKYYGLNKNDFENLKWEDEPVEVFLNMED